MGAGIGAAHARGGRIDRRRGDGDASAARGGGGGAGAAGREVDGIRCGEGRVGNRLDRW